MHPRSHISKPARRQCLPLSCRMFTIFVTCSSLLVSSSGSRLQNHRSSQQTSMLRGRGGGSRYAEEMLDEDDARRRNSYDDSSDMMAPDYDDVEETSSNPPPDLNHPGTSGTSHPPEEPYQGQEVSSNPPIYGSESQYDIDSSTLSTNLPNETGGTEATGPATGVRDPVLSLPKMTYALGEPVVVSFDTGNRDEDMRNWVVGIYMRMANPQRGSLPPIVSIKLCGLLTCDTSVHSGTVEFSEGAAINGDWPMDVNEYGTGYDVYILDEYGSEVTDVAMFNVDDMDESYSSFVVTEETAPPEELEVTDPTLNEVVEGEYQVRDPVLSLSKMTYALGEPVVVSFDTGNRDKDVRNWVVGMYMRDANPQGGSLPPIVSIKLCGLLTCDTSVHSGTVEFSEGAVINGDWPMDVNEYGTGYDVYILDEYGSEVTEVVEFNIDLDESYSSFPPANYYQEEGSSSSIPVNAQTGTLTPPPQSILIPETYQDQNISSNPHVYPPTQSKSDVDNISSAFSTTHVTENEVTEESASIEEVIYPSVTLSKTEYLYGERVVVNFNTGNRNEDVENWVVGIYMRDARPQSGALPPIVSMKLCGLPTCDTSVHSGVVEFSNLHRAEMTGQWPMDIDNFGTGYDMFMLNEYGEEVSEAYEFNVVIDEAE